MSKLRQFGRLGVVAGSLWIGTSAALAGSSYTQTDIVSDGSIAGTKTDASLVNPWGLVASPSGPWWIANNGTGTSSVYDGAGNTQLGPVTVAGSPTGIVFNGGSGFSVTAGGKSGSSAFIYVGEDGKINGWSPAVNFNAAVPAAAPDFGAVYKGATLGTIGGNTFLYASDFHNGQVRIFDSNFAAVDTTSGAFKGAFTDPTLPSGYAPFNVQNIGNKIYVTYALQDSEKHDDVAGAGHGFVDSYDLNGKLLGRFASAGALNSPWGLAVAPSNFGKFSNDLLVGNFGDGKINVFDPTSQKFLGSLGTDASHPLVIGDLWGLSFGNGGSAGLTNELFFTAGVKDEANGLFGKITASATSAVPLPAAAYVGGLMMLPLGLLVRRMRPGARVKG